MEMNLHDRVEALPMSQSQVARQLGVDQAYFSRMIRGIRPMRPDVLERLERLEAAEAAADAARRRVLGL